MRHQSNKLFGLTQLRRASWLALLSLAWMQVALAGHQFEHDGAYTPETCEICVQLDRADDAASHSAASSFEQCAGSGLVLGISSEFIAAVPLRSYDSRAPPTI